MDLESPLRRPVPVKKITLRIVAVPIPLNTLPELRDAAVELVFAVARAAEILAGGQQALHQKRCLDQIAAVVEHAEDGHSLARLAVHVVRPILSRRARPCSRVMKWRSVPTTSAQMPNPLAPVATMRSSPGRFSWAIPECVSPPSQ